MKPTQEQLNISFIKYCSIGDLSKIKALVEVGGDTHTDNEQALRNAAYMGYLEIVKYLVEKEADIHANNEYALRWAARQGHFEIVKFLVKSKEYLAR